MARFFQPKKKKQTNKKHQLFSIEKLDHHGAGIAYENNKPVFIEGALPGEQVLAQYSEVKSKFSRANLIKIQSESESRIEPFCSHYHECGGCNQQHLSLTDQLRYKQKTLIELMSKFAGGVVSLEPVVQGETKGYRRRARISIKFDRKSQQLNFGFRKKSSSQIANITHCPILDVSLDALLLPLYELFKQFTAPDSIGHLELVKGDNTTVIVIRHIKPLHPKDQGSLEAFASENKLSLYLMPDTQTIERVVGERAYYSEGGVRIPFEPNNFIQVNQMVNKAMIDQALSWLDINQSDRVLDLFCGLGNFSLPIAQRVKSVIGVEGIDVMVKKASENAKLNHLNNAEFFQANLEESSTKFSWAQEKFDKVLLDPARAGASVIIDQISSFGASKVVYVSCNPATLARDSQSLIAQGYKLERLGMLDMFPHTSHLESMALFVKE
ncbi:23S rRNA (uracil(1939)-C(5))-methyltransferase RlmD [Vibrio caribbeanicus]|uniref:23S rRNA (uracil(1939)-C(5))-methyltransferase RlmD n=1 Tax=Vibrio caribbeanicus ATCC BAA-2122 TaxID=796620 RepID=E3BFS0_9VIBR|nr:23S rRNA (uracil(1939)-C(5))-methyltransferase RlmD [Vibrio caribbeanicus]EFP98077.1 23S rRNA 5-methyluridine methyltransferase [Vibrio caribbeanicus ATCC BAA-2122]